jgi:hypothetical protein
VVVNLGFGGADTREELRRLEAFPYTPEVLVLAYVPNDIEGAAVARGAFDRRLYNPYRAIPLPVRLLLRHSYTLDFLYWLFPHSGESYAGPLRQAYAREDVMDLHRRDLAALVEYARAKGAHVVVVLSPRPADVRPSTYLDPVRRFFADQRLPVLEVGGLIESIPPAQRVVNKNDGHPSAAVHAVVAGGLRNLLASEGLLEARRSGVPSQAARR